MDLINFVAEWLSVGTCGVNDGCFDAANTLQIAISGTETLEKEMATRGAPVMSWLQPEFGFQFVVGTDSGLCLYRASQASKSSGSSQPNIGMASFKPMRHAVTAMTAYSRAVGQSSMLAVGSSGGQVDLHFYSSQEAASSNGDLTASRECISVYESSDRACRGVAFNPEHSDLLACGFDNKEGHSSLRIYDITHNTDVRQLLATKPPAWSTYSENTDHVYEGSHMVSQHSHIRSPSAASTTSYATNRDGEYGPDHSGSGVTSLSWVPGHADSILAASKKTWCTIQLYDLRARSSGGSVIYMAHPDRRDGSGSRRADTIFDLQFDPFNQRRFMAHDGCGIVNIWDTRWHAGPAHTFDIGKEDIVKVQFSPRRENMLAALSASASAIDIFTLHESGRSSGSSSTDDILADVHVRDRSDSHRAQQKGLSIWTDHATAVPASSAQPKEQNSTFMWVPPAASSQVPSCKQLLVLGANHTPHAVGLPMPKVAAFSCRGDVAMSNNWSRLASVAPSTGAEMSVLHSGVVEYDELTSDHTARNLHAGRGAPEAARRRSSTMAQPKQQQGEATAAIAASGILARRQQAARQQSVDSNMKTQQISDALSAANTGFENGLAISDSSAKAFSAQLYDRLASGPVTYDPLAKDSHVQGSDNAAAALAEDILALMRKRVGQGYGISADKNMRVFRQDPQMRDLWIWIRDAEIRRTDGSFFVAPRMDASFYGTYDIMKLKKKQLDSLYGQLQSPMFTSEPDICAESVLKRQRHLALLYCGWDLKGSIRERHIKALEQTNEHSAAAGASFIYGDHERCLQSLEQSAKQDQKLLSFMFRAQMNESNKLARVPPGNVDAAPDSIFACPHLQMIFTYLVTGDWNRVIEGMGGLPLSYRLAVALRYLGDADLMQYLRQVCRTAVLTGGLDGLIVTGINRHGSLILGQYVDNTADVQTAALVASFDPERDYAAGMPAERWIYAYRHLLNKWRMFTARCLFDIAHGNRREKKGLPRISKVGEQISIRPADVRCTFCHQSVGYDVNKQRDSERHIGGVGASLSEGLGGAGGPGVGGIHGGNKSIGGAMGDFRGIHPRAASRLGPPGSGAGDLRGRQPQPSQTRLLYTHCPKCNNSLPRCTVCRMTLGTPLSTSGGESDSAATSGGEFSQWFSWCQTCGHGGHVSHLQGWFSTHPECPVPGCECECEKSH